MEELLMEAQVEQVVRPRWIARMFASKTGRDHLGLGSVSSDQILPTLSPGVNVLTFHPRYHAFYTFLLDEFWRRDLVRTKANWIRFYRPRAFIFSVGAYLCDRPEHGEMANIVGGQKTGPLAARQHATYDTSYPYIKSELGGYGLYYRSVIAELGLIYPGGPGFGYPVDVPSELGKKVAAAFRRAVRDTEYYRRYFDRDRSEVPAKVVQEYIRTACLCQLRVPTAPDQSLLLDVFLHGGLEPEARRATFCMLLDIAEQTQGYAIDEDPFRQLLYFQAAESGATYSPRDSVLDIYRRWRLYQTREYYAFALNALWYYLCDWGLAQGGDVHPVPLPRLWQHLDLALDFEGLASWLELPTPGLHAQSSLQEVMDWLLALVGADESSFDGQCRLHSPVHEHRLYQLALEHRDTPAIMVAGMVTMLVLIYLRYGHPDLWGQPEWEISRMGADGRLSVSGFLSTLRCRLGRGTVDLDAFVRWLYADYVILQHQLVATSKLPDNTFRFQREGNRLRFYVLPNSLTFMNSRFQALSTTIHELGLCGDFLDRDHSLTENGRRLLAEGDLE
jgi:hypothetical protein